MTTRKWKCPACGLQTPSEGSIRARYHADCGVWMECVFSTERSAVRVLKSPAASRGPRVVYLTDDLPRDGYWGEGGKA